MKKIFLFVLASGVITTSFAQRAKVNEANRELKKATEALILSNQSVAKEALDKAESAIDVALTDASTKDNGKTLFIKSAILIVKQEINEYAADKTYRQGIEFFNKAYEADKKIRNEESYPSILVNGSFYAFNDGVFSMNNSDFEKSYHYFKIADDLLNKDDGSVKKMNPPVDTIHARAKLFLGTSAFYLDKLDEAEGLLTASLKNPITENETNTYYTLAQLYGKKGNDKKQIEIIEAGKKKFPKDPNITAAELNYYLDKGKQEELIAKLEEATAADATNPELFFNLGIVYKDMYNSDKVTDKEGYFNKAEQSYKKALSLNSENATYQYETGAFFYNVGAKINNSLNSITGTDASSLRKYNEEKDKRDKLFAQATPYFEKANAIFKGLGSKISNNDKVYYAQSLDALINIYAITDQLDKMEEAKKVYEGIR